MCRLVEYKKGQYIADIKVKYIENIVIRARGCKNISYIVLFGSSTEERCTKESDIDIAVFGQMSKNRYLESKEFRRFQDELFKYDFDQDYDILYFNEDKEYEDAIMNDIKEGIVIYRSAGHDIDEGVN